MIRTLWICKEHIANNLHVHAYELCVLIFVKEEAGQFCFSFRGDDGNRGGQVQSDLIRH